MAEFRSAIERQLSPGRYGAEKEPRPIRLSEQPLGTFFQIAGWPATFHEALEPICSALGFSGFGRVGRVEEAGAHRAFRAAPERILLRTTEASAWTTAKDLSVGDALALVDLSHARTVVRLEGSETPDLLARLVSIDLHGDVFKENAFSLTGIQTVPVLLHRLRDADQQPRYELYVPYTWAASVWDLLCECASPFGYAVADSRS